MLSADIFALLLWAISLDNRYLVKDYWLFFSHKLRLSSRVTGCGRFVGWYWELLQLQRAACRYKKTTAKEYKSMSISILMIMMHDAEAISICNMQYARRGGKSASRLAAWPSEVASLATTGLALLARHGCTMVMEIKA